MAWTFAARCDAFGGRDLIGVEREGRRLALYRVNGEYFATSDVCPHHGAALSRGSIVEGFVECPVHFALFDIRTGAPDGGTTLKALKTFPTRVENGEIHVDLDA